MVEFREAKFELGVEKTSRKRNQLFLPIFKDTGKGSRRVAGFYAGHFSDFLTVALLKCTTSMHIQRVDSVQKLQASCGPCTKPSSTTVSPPNMPKHHFPEQIWTINSNVPSRYSIKNFRDQRSDFKLHPVLMAQFSNKVRSSCILRTASPRVTKLETGTSIGPTYIVYSHTRQDVTSYVTAWPQLSQTQMSKMQPPMALGHISPERFKRGLQKLFTPITTMSLTKQPDMTSPATSGRRVSKS